MGENGSGQLGDGTGTDSNVSVETLASSVSEFESGYYHNFFKKEDGSLWAMGGNWWGHLGDGTTSARTSPVQIYASGISDFGIGKEHTYFLLEDGSLWTTGYNGHGQLGDGSTTNRTSPVKVVDDSVMQVFGGGNSSYFLKKDRSLWAMGDNDTYGHLGDGTTTDRNTPVQIFSGAEMNPKTLTLNAGSGGAVTGTATFDYNTTATLVATPSNGYVFAGWVGDLSSSDANTTLVMSANYEVNATFSPDTGDDDGDGLTNYDEWVTYTTDANDSDSDGDGLTDAEEVSIGLDPNTANISLMEFFANRQNNARSEGNSSGIAWVQANPGKYGYFSEAEVNASGASNYAIGLNEGNMSGITWVQANPSLYGYFTESEVNASQIAKYESGFVEGNTTGSLLVEVEIEKLEMQTVSLAQSELDAEKGGRAEAIATVQAEFALEKLSFLPYEQEMIKSIPHAVGWFHLQEIGWMWTSPEVFPHLYLLDDQGSGKWLYFDPDTHPAVPYFDHAENKWINIFE
jgi:uncharacterized repeat protein (TIGR02543 family)